MLLDEYIVSLDDTRQSPLSKMLTDGLHFISGDLSLKDSIQLIDYVSDTTYFITITLPKKMYAYSSLTQYEITNHDARKFIRKGIIIPEHTKAGNIHYYCIVKFRDDLEKVLFMNSMKKSRKTGFIDIKTDPLNNSISMLRAFTYMVKDAINTQKVLRRGAFKHKILEIVE